MVGHRLKSIRTDQFSTNPQAEVKNQPIQMATNFKASASLELKEVVVGFRVTFTVKEVPFITLETSCGFVIQPDHFDNFLNKIRNQLEIPRDFMAHLSSITAGVARGVLHEKLKETEFNRYMLPLLDLDSDLKSNIVVKLEQPAGIVTENPEID